jgi:CBS domain containing-hemolysin-like protein
MSGFIIALSLLGIALLALALQRTYSLLSAKELKRRARQKDPIADVLYKAVVYGASLRMLLWIVVVVSASGSFVLLSRAASVPPILAFIVVMITIAYGFVWMPAHHATRFGVQIAVWLTPVITWVLSKLYPLLDRITTFVRRHRPIAVHTGLYERDDLLKLIELQKGQPDSRIAPDTLDLLSHVLTFGDKLVHDIAVPARMVRQVSADEPVGPIVIADLHDSGFSRFPVYDGKPGNIVGTLYLRDLISLKVTGKIRDVCQKNVYYVHEDHPLEQVLDAFLKTQHHMFVVVNNFEEFVGIITIEDILEQILGCKIVDEFDQYDDLRAVAAHQASSEHEKKRKKGQEVMDADADGRNPYDKDTLKYVIYQAGFRDNALEIAYGVAMGESGGKSHAHNDDKSTGDDSYGLFQINMLGAMGPERRKLYNLEKNEDLFDPQTNANIAFELSEAGKNWQPWSVYNNGNYKKHYDPKANHPILK